MGTDLGWAPSTTPATSPPDTAASRARRRIRQRVPGLLRVAPIYVISLIAVIAGWHLAARQFGLELLFPTPGTTAHRLLDMLLDGTALTAALVSMARILAGFAIGSLLGAFLGLLMGSSAVVRALTEPFVHFFRFIPPLAWFAPVLLLFGTGEDSRILLIAYTTIFVVAINTMDGTLAVSANKVRMAMSFGANRWQVFSLVTLPSSMPYILTGMKMAMGNAFMTVVAAEMLAANNGLGYVLISSQSFFDVPAIFAVIVVLGVLGFATDRLFGRGIERFGGRYIAHQTFGREDKGSR